MQEDKILDIETALIDMGGDRDIYTEVLNVFIEDTPRLFSNLSQAREQNDSETVTRLAHTIKSSSRSIGGMALSAIAARLEETSKIATNSQTVELIAKMKTAFVELKHALEEEGF